MTQVNSTDERDSSAQVSHEEVQLLTVLEVAHLLRLSRSKVYVLMSNGELPSVKLGGSRRIKLRSLKELLERRTVHPAA